MTYHPPKRETDPAAIRAALDVALQSTAVAQVNQRRLEQISVHGRTPALDAQKTVGMLIRKMADYASAAMDHTGGGEHVPAERLAIARNHIITSAALGLAIIDRIDAQAAALAAELDQEGAAPGLSGHSQPGQQKEPT